MADLEIRLLGKFALFYKGAPVNGISGARVQCLFAYLLLHRDAPIARQHLAFLFWPDSAEAQARANLRGLLHSLMQTLPEGERFVQAEAQTVQWRAGAPFSLDLDGFQTAVIQAGSAEQLEAAITLYTGELLPECYDDWIAADRERLAEVYRNALQRLVDLLEKQGSYPEAIGHAVSLAHHDPLREAVWRQIMRLHALNGDRAGVARAYRECKTVLKRELDVEPSAQTAAAYEKWVRYTPPAAGAVPPARESRAAVSIDGDPAGQPTQPDGFAPAYPAQPRQGGDEKVPWIHLKRSSPSERQSIVNRIARVVSFAVLVLTVGLLILTAYDRFRPAPLPMALRGCIGGSKAGVLNDPEVQRILLEEYKLQISFETMGSGDMVRCTNGYDFVWPGTEADVERFRQLLGNDLSYETPLNSALVFYSWAEVTDALVRQGVVEEVDGVYYVVDIARMLGWLSQDKEWKDLGLPHLYGRFTVVPTDPTRSESGGLFAVYLTSILQDGHTPDAAEAEQMLPRVRAYFGSLGFLEQSTGKLFDRFLRAGAGDKPIIVAYESQGLEKIAQDPQREQILKKMRIIYPRPTFWVSHPLIALTPGGKQLMAALKDEKILEIAWKEHGFRSGVAGIRSRPEDLLPAAVPASIDSLIALPRAQVMDAIVNGLSGETQR